MSAIDDFVAANSSYAARGGLPGRPGKHLTVLTCMDTRIDPLGAFGLNVGDAHVLRNAGGLVTDDVLRSLVISQRALGTEEIAVVQHTKCGMDGFDDAEFRARLRDETGEAPPWNTPGFGDVRAQVDRSVKQLSSSPWLPHRDHVRGFVYDVDTGRLTEVE